MNGYETAPNDRLNPGRTSFEVRQYYMAYDVTTLVKKGQNVVAMLLGHGWQSMGGASILATGNHIPAARWNNINHALTMKYMQRHLML